MLIIPAILSDKTEVIQQQLDRVEKETKLRRVQLDIVDPEFADNITVSPIDLTKLNLHGFQVDVHLMTNDPINDVIECSQIPGINMIIAQVEHMGSQADFLAHIGSYKIKAGLALDLTTPVEALEEDSFAQLAAVQVMGIRAGAQGQDFAPEVLKKVRTLRGTHPNLEILFDGGVKPNNVASIEIAGATAAAVGSFLWESDELPAAIAALGSIQ